MRVDYEEIFSLVVMHTSIRVLIFQVEQHNMELGHLDVKASFLHGELEEKIDVMQSESFIEARTRRSRVEIKEVIVWAQAIPKTMVQAL